MTGTPCSEDLDKKEVCTYSLTLRKRPQVKEDCCTVRNYSPSPEDLNKKEQSCVVTLRPPCAEELRKKEQFLNQKEKELIKLQKCIQKQRNKLKKKFDTKAKADLKAANKLNRARKKLQLTVNAARNLGGHQKIKKNKTLSCTLSRDTQYKWLDKIHSMLEKFHGSLCSCFCEKRRGFSELCALYVKKIKEATHHSQEVCSRCTRSGNFDYCFGNRPCRSCGCSRLESAAGNCYGMAMGPVLWSWPSPRPPCRMQLKKIGYLLALIASFLFWLPCLLCVALLCSCYSCCCCDCC